MGQNDDINDLEHEEELSRNFELRFHDLAFIKENKEFENHFLFDFYTRSLNQVRFAIFAAIILYALFGIIDAALIPEFKYKFWTFRYLIVIPMLVGVLTFSFSRIFKRKIQFVLASLVILSSFGVIGIIAIAPSDLSNYYFPGLILIVIMNYGFLKLRFIWSAAAGLIASIIYVIGAFNYIEMPYLLCVINSFFLISINIIGLLISRYLEIYARRDYFSNQLLKIERFKLKSLNTRLEAKIKDKSQLIGSLQKEMLDEMGNLRK